MGARGRAAACASLAGSNPRGSALISEIPQTAVAMSERLGPVRLPGRAPLRSRPPRRVPARLRAACARAKGDDARSAGGQRRRTAAVPQPRARRVRAAQLRARQRRARRRRYPELPRRLRSGRQPWSAPACGPSEWIMAGARRRAFVPIAGPAPCGARSRRRLLRVQRLRRGHRGAAAPARTAPHRLRRHRRAPRRRRVLRLRGRSARDHRRPARERRVAVSRHRRGRARAGAGRPRAPSSTCRCRPAPAMREFLQRLAADARARRALRSRSS